jgi:hypothetical protein
VHPWVTTITAIVAGLWTVAAASAQSVDAPVWPHVRLAAHVIARTPSYTRVATDTALIFQDDPISLEVSLANTTDHALRLDAPHWWFDDIQLSMVAMLPSGDPRPIAASYVPVFHDRPPARVVQPDRVTTVELSIRPEAALAPGLYRLSVTLGAVTRELNLEIRQATELAERLDDYLQQAFWASRAERFDDAGMWASRAVAVHPFSVIALAESAHYWRFHGRCMEGVPMLRRAAGIMSLGGDPLLVHPLPESYRDFLQEAAARCEHEN